MEMKALKSTPTSNQFAALEDGSDGDGSEAEASYATCLDNDDTELESECFESLLEPTWISDEDDVACSFYQKAADFWMNFEESISCVELALANLDEAKDCTDPWSFVATFSEDDFESSC